MGCGSCSTTVNGVPQGCGNKGHCTSGSCNKKNAYDWLSDLEIGDPSAYGFVEVSFKKGSRKEYYISSSGQETITGDMVVVESASGYDVGRISLSGDLVRLQFKKKNIKEDRIIHKIIRKANQRDLEKLEEARSLEQRTMVRARVIARTLGLDMKLGDVEYQGDKRKATFYYTAEGRVDFRELVRSYAKEFKIKIEMRQIGARQESARIGGIGSCGRELCCSTWLSDFKSVSTSAARYQNISINQLKLSGQCGRLKCCLNYELDAYMDALKDFPKHADVIKTQSGSANLIKTDIFKGIMYYGIQTERGRGPVVPLDKDKVKELIEMNKKGEKPFDLMESAIDTDKDKEKEIEFADVTGEIELPSIKKKRRNNRNRNRNRNRNKDNDPNRSGKSQPKSQTQSQAKPKAQQGNKDEPKKKPNSRSRNNRNRNRNKGKEKE